MEKQFSKSIINRIPLYLQDLKTQEEQEKNTSSVIIAQRLGLGEVQVRKDLNLIAGNGKPKIGYNIKDLINKIESLINVDTDTIIIGAGKIGEALAYYQGFSEFKFNIVGIFDNDIEKIGKTIANKTIMSVERIKEFCADNKVKLGILAVSSENAQLVCDELIESGIKGILNFTNTKLNLPANIKIRNIDVAAILATLIIEINTDKENQ